MASPAVLKILRKKLELYEGNIEHMYLDKKGYVTIGVGHYITNSTSAQKLTLYTAKGKKATLAEIKLDFDNVKKQKIGLEAGIYKQFTKLYMKDVDIEAITDNHITNFEKELKRVYSGFFTFPKEVKLALFDMIFNLGQTKLQRQYKKMNAAVAKKDWLTAAKESKRRVNVKRDKYVKDLFIKADKIAKANKKTTP